MLDFQRLMSPPDGGDDMVGVCAPDEGARMLTMPLYEAVDVSLKVDNAVEKEVLEAAALQFR